MPSTRGNGDKSRAQRKDRGIRRPEAVIKQAFQYRFGSGEIATKAEIDRTLTAIMRGQFEEFPTLQGIQPNTKLIGMLKAAELLMKRFGMFQAPSQNEIEHQQKVDKLVAAAVAMINTGKKFDGPDPTPEEVMAYVLTLEPEMVEYGAPALALLKKGYEKP